MTKFYNEIKFVPSTPKTYEVRYMESKQSGLSPAARSKVINRSGSNYISERTTINNPGYGPGFWEGVEEVAREIGDGIKYTFTQGIKNHKEEIISTALAISYATPAAAVTVPATIAAGAAGGVSYLAGKATGDEQQVETGKSLMRVSGGAAAGNAEDFQSGVKRIGGKK